MLAPIYIYRNKFNYICICIYTYYVYIYIHMHILLRIACCRAQGAQRQLHTERELLGLQCVVLELLTQHLVLTIISGTIRPLG